MVNSGKPSPDTVTDEGQFARLRPRVMRILIYCLDSTSSYTFTTLQSYYTTPLEAGHLGPPFTFFGSSVRVHVSFFQDAFLCNYPLQIF